MSLGNWKAFNLVDVGLINVDMMVNLSGAQESLNAYTGYSIAWHAQYTYSPTGSHDRAHSGRAHMPGFCPGGQQGGLT